MALTLRDRLDGVRPAGSGPIHLHDEAVEAYRRHYAGVRIGEPLESPPNDSDLAADIVAEKKAALKRLRPDELLVTHEATNTALSSAPPGTGWHANLERGMALILTAAVEGGIQLAVASEPETPDAPPKAADNSNPERPTVRRRSPVVVARETLGRSLAGKYRNHASACREIEWRLDAGVDAVLTGLKKNPSQFGTVVGNGPLEGPELLDPHVEASVSGLAEALGRKKI